MYRNLWQFSIHQNDPTLRCIPAKRDHVNSALLTSYVLCLSIYVYDMGSYIRTNALPVETFPAYESK